jgi:hypothetical protein
MFVHSLMDSMFNTGFNVSSNFCAMCKRTRINNRRKKLKNN